MKCAVILLVALSVFALVESRTVSPSRHLTALNKRAVCRAGTRIKIKITEEGRCDAWAEAHCDAFVQLYEETKKVAVKWEADGICQKNSIGVAASSLATVLARVWVKAVTAVRCETKGGKGGLACGWSVSDGFAQGRAIAQTIVQALADADPNKEDFAAFCEADVEAIADIYTEVTNSARADACTKGGFDGDIDENYKSSMKCALANALARAAAGFCQKQGGGYGKEFEQEFAWSKCTGTGEVLKWVCD